MFVQINKGGQIVFCCKYKIKNVQDEKLGHLKKSLVYHPIQIKNAMQVGRFF